MLCAHSTTHLVWQFYCDLSFNICTCKKKPVFSHQWNALSKPVVMCNMNLTINDNVVIIMAFKGVIIDFNNLDIVL